MANALYSVIVTTHSLEQTKPYYIDGLKLLPAEELNPDPAKMKKLWGLDQEFKIRSLVLKRKKEYSHGYIRLVELQGADRQRERPP